MEDTIASTSSNADNSAAQEATTANAPPSDQDQAGVQTSVGPAGTEPSVDEQPADEFGGDFEGTKELPFEELITQALAVQSQLAQMATTIVGIRYSFEGYSGEIALLGDNSVGEVQQAMGLAAYGEEGGLETIGNRLKEEVASRGDDVVEGLDTQLANALKAIDAALLSGLARIWLAKLRRAFGWGRH